jgi:hypothetical protein
MDEILHLSARVAVMTQRGRSLLRDVYGVSADRIDVIPHGIPDMGSTEAAAAKHRLGLEGRSVLLTFGLLSPAKGIEHVIEALPRIVADHPDVLYVVLGTTHPHLVAREGERYRDALRRRAAALGVEGHVSFHDRYVDLPDLLTFLGAADIYVTPYLNEDQITSGTLAYAFGCGKPVISTPYWHAQELLADDHGVLVPFASPDAIAAAACDLLGDDARRQALGARAWRVGREMVWSRVAERYVAALRRTRESVVVKPRRGAARSPERRPRQELPPVRLDHLLRLTDSTGLLQHATYDIPNAADGYCTDDNARARRPRPRLAGRGPGGHRLRHVPRPRLRTGDRPVSQFPVVRPPLARRRWHRRLPRACRGGDRSLHRPRPPPGPAGLGHAALRPRARGARADHEPAGLGARDHRHPGCPAPARWRPPRRRRAGPAHGAARRPTAGRRHARLALARGDRGV